MAYPEAALRVRSSLNADLDSRQIRSLTGYHRIRPLFYKRITEHGTEFVPADLTRDLEVEFQANTARNPSLTALGEGPLLGWNQ